MNDEQQECEYEHVDVSYFGQHTNKEPVYRCNDCGRLFRAHELSEMAIQHAEVRRYVRWAKLEQQRQDRLLAEKLVQKL